MYDPMNINQNENAAGQEPENNTPGNPDNWKSLDAAESVPPTEQTSGQIPESSSQASAQANEPITQPQQPSWQDASTSAASQQNTQGYSEYRWQGNGEYQEPVYQQPAYQSWEGADHYTAPVPPQKPKKERKPMSRGAKIATKIVAGVLCCALVSAASVGGFAALINNGTVQVNNAGSGDATFTINKLINSDENNPSTSVSGSMTQQEVAAKVIPSVVCIQNYQQSDLQQGLSTQGWGRNSYGDSSEESSEEDSAVSPASEGSGIIATSDGYIITNAHVVDGADSLKVITSDGQTYEAELIGSDSMTDLAVIKIEATGLTAAEFGSSDDLVVADPVIAIGNPGGLQFNSTVTIGYVSALNRSVTNSETGYTMECIQTDAAINPGNSGGALVNMYGQVIGINSSKIVATGYEGLGFAIPIDDALPIISDLKEYGYVKDRAMLGISGQYLDSWTANFYGLTPGMYVASISNESVTQAGIQKGDVITKIDDTDVTSANTISGYIAKKKPGDTVTLSVTRGLTGESFTCTVTLTESTGQ